MRKVIAIASSAPEGMVDLIREKTATTRFLGAWGRIEFNREECIMAIVNAVRFFGETDETKTILFACHKDDLADIVAAVRTHLGDCDLGAFGELETI